jgi:LmbE family N-acetylglucosaminyl deacetylase
MKTHGDFVSAWADLIARAKALPLGQAPFPTRAPAAPAAPKALLFSPHPDDEVVVGGLAYRLQRQSGWEVVNVAVTQGSNPARRAARWEELERCCRYLGFRLVPTRPGGLEGINRSTPSHQPKLWTTAVERVVEILQAERPRAIFFPHDQDWNSTHLGTNLLVLDALARIAWPCYTVETEFWGAMAAPNLMVESSPEDVGELTTALTFHVGEVRRNPYHVRMPAWMMDNVRRGCELVGSQGGASPDYLFATLYRVRQWRGGRLDEVWPGGRFLGKEEQPAACFPGDETRQAPPANGG